MILHFTTSKIWKLESDFRLESKRVELLIIWVFCNMIAIYQSFTICCVFAFCVWWVSMQAQTMMRRQAPTWQAPLLSSLKEESIDCLQLSVSRVAHVCPSEMTGGWRSVDMEITFIGLYIVDGWGSTVIVYCCACCCYLSFILFFVRPFCSSLLCFFSFLVFLVAAGAWWCFNKDEAFLGW